MKKLKNIARKIFYRLMRKKIEKLCYSKENIKKITNMKGMYKGQRCFIVGNGPSLSYDDLSMIKNEYCFAANKIYKIFNKTEWRPNFICCQDPTILREIAKELSEVDKNITKFISPTGEKKCEVKDAIYFYKNNKAHEKRVAPKFSDDISECCYDGYTIVYSMIQIATYLGFDKIYLLGLDCNYSIDEKNSRVDKKSYMDETMAGKNKTVLPDYEYWFMAYEIAKKYCEEKNIKIENSTRGGKLEVFTRKSLERVLGK